MNSFLKAVSSYDTYTENGAVSHSTSGDSLLDYFANAGAYRDRDIASVHADMGKIWAESPKMTLQMLFYLRMITRQVSGLSEKIQKGQGSRDEFRKAIGWVAKYHPDMFAKNMWLIPHVGCWKDLWHKDLAPHLDENQVLDLIKEGIQHEYHAPLIAKYLPKIRSASNTHNDEHKRKNTFARKVCSHLNWTEKAYRRFKSSGQSHQFQRDMSERHWSKIDFSKIPGKALLQIASNKGRADGKTTLERHDLEKRYIGWLAKQPTAKFTGYPYELFKSCGFNTYGPSNPPSLAQKMTIDKQFEGLLEKAKKDEGGIKGNVWCAIDTSASMGCGVAGNSGVTAFEVCVSLGVYFSSLNEGTFKDNIIMFDSESSVKKLSGGFVDKCLQITNATTAWGSTNFQSVIDEIIRIRKTNPKIPLSDYPETILVVSDMQFNPSDRYRYNAYTTSDVETNYNAAMRKLKAVGLPNVKVVWWDCTGRKTDMPSKAEDAGTTLISGFDGAIITNILGGETKTVDKKTGKVRELNAYENMLKALDQEVLNMVTI